MGKRGTWGTGWMVIAQVLIGVIIVLIGFFPSGANFSWITFWQAAAAVATAAAAGVALWLGWREGEWRRKAESDQVRLAVFYAVSVRTTWDEAEQMLRGVQRALEYAQVEAISGDDIGVKADHCGRRLSTLDFQALGIIDAKAALQIAEVPHLLHILSVFAGSRGYVPGDDDSRLLVEKGMDLVADIEERFKCAHEALFAKALCALE